MQLFLGFVKSMRTAKARKFQLSNDKIRQKGFENNNNLTKN